MMCDEFGSVLHRRLAKAIAYGLRKIVTRRRLVAVVACSNEDIIADLQPDTIAWLKGGGRCAIEERSVQPNRPFSLRRRLRIEPGSKRDYESFASMHSRASAVAMLLLKATAALVRDDTTQVSLSILSYAPSVKW